MKYLLAILLFIYLQSNTTAQNQYAVTGMPGSIYFDINPDTLLNPASVHNGGVDHNYYYVDINLDGTNDIKIDAIYSISPNFIDRRVDISSLDTSTKFSYWKTDSSFCYNPNCCQGYIATGDILTQYSFGDTVKNNKYINYGTLAMNGGDGMCGISYNDAAWIKSYDQYIGVRYSSTSGYQYGWVRVNVSDYQTVLVKDFSLGTPLVGISSFFASAGLKTYPNPASNQLFIDATTTEKFLIALYDVNGRCVLQNLVNNKAVINLQNLNNGIYTLTIKFTDHVINKKLVVAH